MLTTTVQLGSGGCVFFFIFSFLFLCHPLDSIQFFFLVKKSSFVLFSLPILVPSFSIQWKKKQTIFNKIKCQPKVNIFFRN
jgi:hypothetical protein